MNGPSSIQSSTTKYEENYYEVFSPKLGNQADSLAGRSNTYFVANVVWFPSGESFYGSHGNQNDGVHLHQDAWVGEIRSKISSYRHLSNNIDSVGVNKPIDGLLDLAELFVLACSDIPVKLRPKFSVDMDGLPTFITSYGNKFVDISIEADESITWYSMIDGVEDSGEAVNAFLTIDYIKHIITEVYK